MENALASSRSPLLLPASQPEAILAAARLLRDGGIVAIPTDTVYGLAASVFQPAAIERIFVVKRRAPDTALPVLLASAVDLPILVEEISALAWRLINHFWPGPLTLVLPAKASAPHAITRGQPTIAVRVPADRVALLLLQSLGEPVVGTSANRRGEPPALGPGEVVGQFGSEIDAVLVDESRRIGVASTVVEVRGNECIVHREGAIEASEIRRTIGSRITVRR